MTTKAQLTGSEGTFLACEFHQEPYSANPGDYFFLPDDHVFTCPDCGEEMHEYRSVTRYARVS